MEAPPRRARTLLDRALRDHPAGSAILGDLHEDFVRMHRDRGPGPARRWYWGQALSLAAGFRVRDALHHLRSMDPMTRHSSLRAVLQDARYAGRALRRAPGFALFTAGVIALGVGATTAVFSVLRPLMLAPLPFEHPQELVWIQNEATPGDQASLSAITSRSGNLRDFRRESRSFQGLTGFNAFSDQSSWNLTGGSEPESLTGYQVAHDFLDVLGVDPLHGRGFTELEGRADGPRAVLLSHGFWQRRFAGDPGMVGRTVNLNRTPYTVVGVLPPTFGFASFFAPGRSVDILLPFPVGEPTDGWGNTMFFIGRMKSGVGPQQAQADLAAVVAGLEEAEPDRWGLGAEVTPLQAHIAGPLRPALLLLTAAAATMLLIVAVNVANLLLARGPRRAREMAVRKALGAPRGRLARQLLLESVFVAGLGSVLGFALAWGATEVVASAAGTRIPLLESIRVDGAAGLFAVTVALCTGTVVGLVPAWRLRDGGEAAALRSGGRGGSSSRGARRLREALVVTEVALACGILVVGGLLLRSFQSVLDVELGFEPSGVVAWTLNPSEQFPSNEAALEYFAAFPRRVRDIPGVEAVGMIDKLPLEGNRSWGFQVVGAPPEENEGRGLFPHIVDPGYLDALRISLREGRGFTGDDTRESAPVVLMNATAARRVFPEGAALGRRIRLWDGREWEVVGIVDDVRHVSPEMGAGIEVYLPLPQMVDFNTLALAVRSSLEPEALAAAVGPVLGELDPDLPTREWWPLQETVDDALSSRRFTLRILSAFALAALLLAGLGIYGVLAQSVAERRPEIGIRRALGATMGGVVGGVLTRTLVLALGGMAVGGLLGWWGTRMVGSLLFGVGSGDPATFAGVGLCLLVVAALAAVLPAYRAARVPGVRALRAE